MKRPNRTRSRRRHLKPLPLRTAIRIVLGLGVLLILGLAQLHVRFSLNTVQRETRRLQALQRTLSSEVNALRGETESLKHPEVLFEYGRRELGMVRYGPEPETLTVPRDVRRRYDVARSIIHPRRVEEERGGLRRAGQWLQAVGNRIGLAPEAAAGETH